MGGAERSSGETKVLRGARDSERRETFESLHQDSGDMSGKEGEAALSTDFATKIPLERQETTEGSRIERVCEAPRVVYLASDSTQTAEEFTLLAHTIAPTDICLLLYPNHKVACLIAGASSLNSPYFLSIRCSQELHLTGSFGQL